MSQTTPINLLKTHPLALLPATHSDLPTIVKTQFAAFHPHDTLHVLLYPAPEKPTEDALEKAIERQKAYWEEGGENVRWVKIEDGGEIIAAAKWFIWPGTSPSTLPTWPDKFDVTWINEHAPMGINFGLGAEDKEYVAWIMEQFFGRRRERVRGKCALLDMCFTSPLHHRRGAGKMLVEYGIQQADTLGLKCYVEASFTGRRLYESCGFVVTEHVCLDAGTGYGKVEYLWMEREARGGEE